MDAAVTGAVPHLRDPAGDQVSKTVGLGLGMAQGDDQGELPGSPGRPGGGRSNLRTALVLLSIALVFFVGVIVNRLLFN